MSEPSRDNMGFFPDFDPEDLARLAGPLPTWGLSTESPWQQWGLAEGIVRGAPGNQVLMSAAAGLLAWSWQQRPLYAPALALLLTLDGEQKFLSPKNRSYLQALKKRLRPLPPHELWDDIKTSGNSDELPQFLEQAVQGQNGTAWIGEAWDEIVRLSDRDKAANIIRIGAGDDLLSTRLLAELDYHHGLDFDTQFDSTPFAPWAGYMAGRLAALSGDFAHAAACWRSLHTAMPWNVNLTLLLHDAVRSPSSDELPRERAAILAYSWNKAELISQTLESVFASDIGDNPVFVLDNGSTDETPQALQAAMDRFGKDRLTVVTLPVNVGAPAARNWLLSLPEVRACRYAAFLDDDVILPRHWLATLLKAAARHPECGVVGCTIRDHEHPHGLQSADYHLLHRLPGEAGDEPGERLRVFNNCTGALDAGLFAYERPCLSVSGCCHLLDLTLLDSVGTFDVRFTPTQFDDLDRDIRCFLAGKPCLYAGRLAIDHVQRSSLRQASSPAQVAHILGNKIKLEAKYDNTALDMMIAKNFEMVWRDLLQKQAELS
ncbi:MAG: glycosyltransferase [Desulfovibrio sp.]|nr:glycosyltransferase [Desulfovibrio sp.]